MNSDTIGKNLFQADIILTCECKMLSALQEMSRLRPAVLQPVKGHDLKVREIYFTVTVDVASNDGLANRLTEIRFYSSRPSHDRYPIHLSGTDGLLTR